MIRFVALFVCISAGACTPNRVVTLRSFRPSPFEHFGDAIAVQPIENEGDSDLTAQLRAAVATASAFHLVGIDDARVVVSGRVLQNTADPERVESNPTTCHRDVPVTRTRFVSLDNPALTMDATGPDQAPPAGYRSETYTATESQAYACTELVRTVSASVVAHLRAMAATRPMRLIFEDDFAASGTERTTGLSGSDNDDHEPAPIDPFALRQRLVQRVVYRFADRALPHNVDVGVEFADCGDARCDEAIELARGGAVDAAIARVTLAVDALAARRDAAVRPQLCAAFFNRGAMRAYGAQIEAGIADLQTALQSCPERAADWSQHLAAAQRRLGLLREAETREQTTTTNEDAAGTSHGDAPPGRRHPHNHHPRHPASSE